MMKIKSYFFFLTGLTQIDALPLIKVYIKLIPKLYYTYLMIGNYWKPLPHYPTFQKSSYFLRMSKLGLLLAGLLVVLSLKNITKLSKYIYYKYTTMQEM